VIFVWLLVLVPVAAAARWLLHLGAVWVFGLSIAALVPLAEWIRRATDRIARSAGGSIGGLLNVTFGNAAELVLGLFVLAAGHTDVVKAQITGSIIGNSLLGLGLAVVVGSVGRSRTRFGRANASRLSTLLMLALIALLIPALFDLTERRVLSPAAATLDDERLSVAVSIVLILVYGANLVYTLVTHRDFFALDARSEPEPTTSPEGGSVRRAVAILVAATAATAVMSELVSDTVSEAGQALSLTPFFLGAVVLAVIGNAAEYVAAVYFGRRGRMDLVLTITVGSTIQIALFIAPVLVLVSHFTDTPMNLVFANPLELVAVGAVALIVNAVAEDGEATWFEGVLLLAVYALLVLAFFYLSPAA
jgi:Ca2+:H+ antiporter